MALPLPCACWWMRCMNSMRCRSRWVTRSDCCAMARNCPTASAMTSSISATSTPKLSASRTPRRDERRRWPGLLAARGADVSVCAGKGSQALEFLARGLECMRQLAYIDGHAPIGYRPRQGHLEPGAGLLWLPLQHAGCVVAPFSGCRATRGRHARVALSGSKSRLGVAVRWATLSLRTRAFEHWREATHGSSEELCMRRTTLRAGSHAVRSLGICCRCVETGAWRIETVLYRCRSAWRVSRAI